MDKIQTSGNFKTESERQSFLDAIPRAAEHQATLEEAKAKHTAYINAMREQACEADSVALGHNWQADNRSKERLNAAISLALAGLPLPATWRASDNVDVAVVNIGILLAIAGAMSAQVQLAYQHSWQLKGQVASATSISNVISIIW